MTFKTIPIISKQEVIPPLPSSILEVYDLDWREFLRRKNYNQDINKMCDLCIKDQVAKYGEQTIKCNGIKRFDEMFPKEIVDTFDRDELDAAKELIDPYFWADRHLDIRQENPDRRIFSRRWYQEFMTSCSANRKAIRCGRRVGKSYSLALDSVHRMMTNPGYRILVVTPYLTQAKELAELVRNMIRHLDLGTWDELVERSVTAPNHEIKLKNGSIFKAFTAGGSDAGSVRGQGADLVILDEADFLSQEAFNAVGAILADRRDTELICTSTPYGENILFKLSQSPEYKEFHFPTFVLPHYSDDLDKDFRNQSDIAGYVEEIQALFGLDTSTAFQAEFVDRARMHEQTNPDVYLRNRDNYIMALGCDWNGDKVGTRICITAYNKTTGKISIAKMDNVSKEGWTQVAAVKKIIELNRLYNIDHIYVDEGFGEANVQALKLHAVNNYGKLPYDHPDLRLDEVVAVNFASTLELRDIVTGEIRKKYYKNFMVETVNRGLETEALDLSGRIADDVVKQMKNYVIKSTTSNGRKIYEAKDHEIGDHDLDAYMLAVTALHLEHNSILDQREISNIQILPIEKSTNHGYNEASSIGNRITDEELNRVASNLFYSYKNNMPSVGRTDSITNSRGGVLGKSRAIMSSRSTRSRLLSGR